MATTTAKHTHHFHIRPIVDKAKAFIKKNAVLCIAIVAAFVTCIIVPPDKAYLDYFDLKTLTCLFCVLAVVCALRNIRFFYEKNEYIVFVFRFFRGKNSHQTPTSKNFYLIR